MDRLVIVLVGMWIHWLLSWLVYGSIGSCLGWYVDPLILVMVGILIDWLVSWFVYGTIDLCLG